MSEPEFESDLSTSMFIKTYEHTLSPGAQAWVDCGSP